MKILSLPELLVLSDYITAVTEQETAHAQNILNSILQENNNPLVPHMRTVIEIMKNNITRREIGKIFPVVLTNPNILPAPPRLEIPEPLNTIVQNFSPESTLRHLQQQQKLHGPARIGRNEIYRMPIGEIMGTVVLLWSKNRGLLEPLPAGFQRAEITRSFLCEFFASKKILLTMNRNQFAVLPKSLKKKCQTLMEISTWKTAKTWESFHDLAEEELNWGLRKHQQDPNYFANQLAKN